MSTSQDVMPVGLQALESLRNNVPREPTSGRFLTVPRYCLPSYIEDGDPMDDEEILRSNRAPPVGYKSYGGVPVRLFEHSSTIAESQRTKSIPLTASHNTQQQWWDDIPNEEIPRLRLTASDLKPSTSNFDKYIQEQDEEGVSVECKEPSTGLVGFDGNKKSKEHAKVYRWVNPSNMTISSSENPPPVWTQQDHPYSWKARLARGETAVMITQDAYRLLMGLDPTAYSLPYGSIVFALKTTSEANIRASMQHSIWCSTGMGNNTLQRAWNKLGSDRQKIVFLFSVSGSKKYCGMAEMSGPVDSDAKPGIWTGRSLRGAVPVRWIVCKDVTFVLFQNILNAQNDNVPITTLGDATALPETLGREVVQTYIEAPHFGNILLGSTPRSLRPGLLQPVIPIQHLGGLTAQSPAPDRQDIPMNVPLSPETLIRYSRQYARRRLGYPPRIVGATNVQDPQPASVKRSGLPLSPDFAKPSGPGRVPGATNDATNRERNVRATDTGDDVGSESGNKVFYRPGQDN